jgi:Protein of unknown function, DUF481
MTLRVCSALFFIPSHSAFFSRGLRRLLFAVAFAATITSVSHAQAASNSAPDTLVLSNGDTLHGKFVNAIQGTITFHSDPLGDITLTWDKIKELHTAQKLAVIDNSVKLTGRKSKGNIPTGTVSVENKTVTVQPESGPARPPIPQENVPYIVDETTVQKEINHSPGFFEGWNGAVTAGATVVTATQDQYSFAGALGLVRIVPTVAWLNPRDRTSVGFLGSYGKITEPSYFDGATFVPAVTTKTAIYHAEAERDEYLTQRVYALGQVAFDHNYSQNLDLQQIYGGGIGWTVLKTPTQALDLKATIQYERQKFITGLPGTTEKNLVGSTFAGDYLFKAKFFTFAQGVEYIPAYNDWAAYSVNETNALGFVAYKNFGFTIGTIDSYLNDPAESLPPTKRNSFQFTMGLTYNIKSKY